MKAQGVVKMVSLLFFLVTIISAKCQSLNEEVPGDHFSLEGALELFKKSSSPEHFEQLLNAPESRVNNLDLNLDGEIDYIRVIDRQDGNVHLFVLQAVISTHERQDIAVIELEKLANGEAVLQITGDSDIYGVETIIEPTEEVRLYAGTTTVRNVVNVWTWPSVQYIYSPSYVVWISPWHWTLRPIWWRPWRPVSYDIYSPWWDTYRPYYSVCHSHRIAYAPQLYRPYRCYSPTVYDRHQARVTHYRSSSAGREHRERYEQGRNSRQPSHVRTYQEDRPASNGRSREGKGFEDRDWSSLNRSESQQRTYHNREQSDTRERVRVNTEERSNRTMPEWSQPKRQENSSQRSFDIERKQNNLGNRESKPTRFAESIRVSPGASNPHRMQKGNDSPHPRVQSQRQESISRKRGRD
jgi:hypothetical protein